jgi:hypothetical protein
MKWRVFPFFLVLFLACICQAQPGFVMKPGLRQVDIPFEFSNNFIIITLVFNDAVPLKFIFDTGAEHTILSKREVSDALKIKYDKEFKITGSDLTTQLIAYLVRQVKFEVPGRIIASKIDILVLQEDYFRFEEYAGVNVHGILAANVFDNYIIKINYAKHILTLYERSTFKVNEAEFRPFDLELLRNKIYLNTHVSVSRDSVTPVKLLVDTGAGLPLLLFINTNPLLQPPVKAIPSNIGMGMGGYLQGFTGRIFKLELGDLSLQNVVSFFQTIDTSAENLEQINHRNGLIGNSILSRYQVIFDYIGSKMWLKPNKNYQSEFVYDRSGISLIASGLTLNIFTIQNVLPNSPAWNVDIRRGDEILKVGYTPAQLLTLDEILKVFQKKPGKSIKIVLLRDGKRLKKTIVLKDLL